jgi:signal recognition particle receptor subunit beta
VVLINPTSMQMTVKIVYYGPGLCGKTTNLQWIHQKIAPKSRGEMVSLETQADRTLFFDLLPLDVGVVGGFKVLLQLYTVPGQVFYNATRKLVLKGVDGVVFVADSQDAMLDANTESLHNLYENLTEQGVDVNEIPMVFQLNKRDLRNIRPANELAQALGTRGLPVYEAAALHGVGVFETLKEVCRLTITSIRDSARAQAGEPASAPPGGMVVAPAPPPPPPLPPKPTDWPPAAEPVWAPSAQEAPREDTLEDLVGDVPPVEFAEEDSDAGRLRAVPTEGPVDIEQKLATLRVQEPSPPPPSKLEFRRTATIDVPALLLDGCTTLNIHVGLAGDAGGETLLRDAASVKLETGKRLGQLTLHLELELKGQE